MKWLRWGSNNAPPGSTWYELNPRRAGGRGYIICGNTTQFVSLGLVLRPDLWEENWDQRTDLTHTFILSIMCIGDQHITWGGTKWKQAIWQSVQPLKRVVVLPRQSQWNLRTTDTTRADLRNWLGEILYVRTLQSWNKHFSSHMLSEVAKITSSRKGLPCTHSQKVCTG